MRRLLAYTCHTSRPLSWKRHADILGRLPFMVVSLVIEACIISVIIDCSSCPTKPRRVIMQRCRVHSYLLFPSFLSLACVGTCYAISYCSRHFALTLNWRPGLSTHPLRLAAWLHAFTVHDVPGAVLHGFRPCLSAPHSHLISPQSHECPTT